MNLALLRREQREADVYAFIESHKNALLLPDQDILTALYGSRVKMIDSQLYNLSDRILAVYNANPAHPHHNLHWVRQHTVIIHYCGRNKPWKSGYVGILDVFYRELKEQQKMMSPTEKR